MLKNEYLAEIKDYPNLVIEFDDEGEGQVVYTEYLKWHIKYQGKDMKKLLESDGWLTEEALTKIKAVITKHVKDSKSLSVVHGSGDEPNFEASYSIGKHETEESAWDAAHDFYAVLANITDPGTYGWDYLFSEISR